MSIVRACVRLAAVAALRDRMWTKAKIFDSDNRPLQDAVTEDPSPYVVVFTDDDSFTDIEAREITSASRSLQLVVEFGIAAPMEAASEGEGPTVAIPATDGAFELVLDCLDAQIINALVHDSASQYGEHFRRLVPKITQVDGKRGGTAEKGARWAVRQRIFHVRPLVDPPIGDQLGPNSAIMQFLAAAEAADPRLDISAAVPFLRSVMTGDPAISWRLAQEWLGMSADETRGIGVAPPDNVIPDNAETVVITKIDSPGTLPVAPGPPPIEGIP